MPYRLTQEPIERARQHVQQGERLVTRQQALIAGLQRHGHAELAATATGVLDTIATSLALARGDLAELERPSNTRFLDIVARRYARLSSLSAQDRNVTGCAK